MSDKKVDEFTNQKKLLFKGSLTDCLELVDANRWNMNGLEIRNESTASSVWGYVNPQQHLKIH